MGLPDLDHSAAHSFMVELDGVAVPDVIDVSGLKIEIDKIEMKSQDATGQYLARVVPGRKKTGELTVTRGVTANKAISDWFGKVHAGDLVGARKTAAVTLLDYTHAPIKKYTLTNCWVKSFEISSLKAGATEPATEKFVISFDDINVE
jgi:phage tail-like protein